MTTDCHWSIKIHASRLGQENPVKSALKGQPPGANDFDKAQILAAADDPWATRLRTGGASKGGSVGRIW